MANADQLKHLRAGVDAWNAWRRNHLVTLRPDLERADLRNANLDGAIFLRCDFQHADFSGASLLATNFHESDLTAADFRGASVLGANFTESKLTNIDLSHARAGDTVFGNTDLSTVKGLATIEHTGRSIVDHRTLMRSGALPLSFLRGCGLPDNLIEYLPSLLNQPIEYYSCFISYSSKNQEFADRIHADLQNYGVRCWFAPHDLPIGAKTWDGIDEAIRTRDKVLLILSEAAISSDWVEDEVTKAFAEERRRKEVVLFPIRLDNSVKDANEPWAGKLRDNRNIGDFTRWKDHDAYQVTLKRLLRDLKIES